MTGCAEHRMLAGGRNIDTAGSLQEAAIVGEDLCRWQMKPEEKLRPQGG